MILVDFTHFTAVNGLDVIYYGYYATNTSITRLMYTITQVCTPSSQTHPILRYVTLHSNF